MRVGDLILPTRLCVMHDRLLLMLLLVRQPCVDIKLRLTPPRSGGSAQGWRPC